MDKRSLEYKIKRKTANTNNKTKRLCDKAKGLAGMMTPCAWSQQRRCPLKMLSNVGTTELQPRCSRYGSAMQRALSDLSQGSVAAGSPQCETLRSLPQVRIGYPWVLVQVQGRIRTQNRILSLYYARGRGLVHSFLQAV